MYMLDLDGAESVAAVLLGGTQAILTGYGVDLNGIAHAVSYIAPSNVKSCPLGHAVAPGAGIPNPHFA